MTRGQEPSITNNNPSENVSNAILALSKNVLGQNVTKSIEPMIKRFSLVETHDDPALVHTTLSTPLNKQQLVAVPLQSIDAKRKKTKSKTKRKDQQQHSEKLTIAEQLEPAAAISESRKISIF
jgi:hypothetical protein